MEKKNPLLPDLEVFFEKIVELQFTLFQLHTVLHRDLNRKKKNINFYKTSDFLSGSRLVISDLTEKTNEDWGHILLLKFLKQSGFLNTNLKLIN